MPPKTTNSVAHGVAHGQNHVSLSEAYIGKLAAPTSGELKIYDTKVAGLLLRWRAGGTSPRWYLQKRVRDRVVRSALGELSSWPAVSVVSARTMATHALANLATGVSPSDVRKKARQDKADKEAQVLPMLDVWKRHSAILTERGRTPGHIREIELLATQSAAAGVDDLRHPGVAAKAEDWLMKQDIAPATRRRRRGHFKDLGSTAKIWWKLSENPFAAIEMTKPIVADVELFTLDECFSLMSDDGLKHVWGPMGALLMYHGFRLLEGLWMHWDRIDPAVGVLRVSPPTSAERKLGYRVKGNKAREIPLQMECLRILENLPRHADGYVFPLEFRQWTRKWHWQRFKDWCRSVGIDPGERHPHTLRHQRATIGLASNEGELRLQLGLGHAGSIMTAHYAKKAMRWKKALGHWQGTMRFRDPVEVARLSVSANTRLANEA